jgi:hypothetical protein
MDYSHLPHYLGEFLDSDVTCHASGSDNVTSSSSSRTEAAQGLVRGLFGLVLWELLVTARIEVWNWLCLCIYLLLI